MALKGFGTATINDIRMLEQKYNVKLPNDYIEFLLQYNGGNVNHDDKCSFYVGYLNDNIHVDILLGTNIGNKDLNIDTWTDYYRHDINKGMLIIGHSYEHGFIVINCLYNNHCVSYWDHAYEFECSSDESNNYFLAATFSDFIKRIIPSR